MSGPAARIWNAALDLQLLQILIDIAIVSYLIYRAMLLVRGTRTMQILFGFGALMILFLISGPFGFTTTHWITNNFFNQIVLVLIILFQSDIRQALSQVGYGSFFGGRQPRMPRLLGVLTQAAHSLSARKIGALIVIQRRVGLRDYISLGTAVDAEPTAELLLAIFHPHSPLHDGAVILQGGRIATAGCFLPLSTDPAIDKRFGTRHRAALGISQESDAVVLVVSEETGAVSVVHEGKMDFDLDEASLASRLAQLLGQGEKKPLAASPPETPTPAES